MCNPTGVLFHAAERGTLYAKYIRDVEQEGDNELADFFRQVQQQDAQRAQQAKSLLGSVRGRRIVTQGPGYRLGCFFLL